MLPESSTDSAFDALPWASALKIVSVACPGGGVQEATLVAAATTTVRASPTFRSPKLHDSTLEATLQGGLPGDTSDQVKPAGSVSTSCTFVAVPGPLLVTTMVKVALS